MKQTILIVLGIMCLAGCASSDSFFDTKPVKMPTGFWKLSAQKAAVEYARMNLDERNLGEVSRKENTKFLGAGIIEYGGYSNMYGVSNYLVRFGKQSKTYKINFGYGYMRRGDFEGDQLARCLLLKEPASKRAEFLARVVSEFRNLEVAFKDGDYAISRNSIRNYNPPTTVNGLRVYDGKCSIIYKEEAEGLGLYDQVNYSKLTNSIMKKHEKLIFSKKSKPFDPYNTENRSLRAELIKNAKEILQDPNLPYSFKIDLLQGIRYSCIDELKPDVEKLSLRHAKEARYVREYEKLSEKYNRLDYSYEKVKNTSSYKRYSELLSRFVDDDEQNMRRVIDMTLSDLKAVGNVDEIRRMIIAKDDTAHLLYHLFRTDIKSYQLLTLAKLKISESAWERRLLLLAMMKHAPNQLLKYLETASDLEFTRCAANVTDFLRKEKPEWKLRLQKALASHHNVVKDRGFWPLDGLEAIVPVNNPRYFNDSIVKKLIVELEDNLDQFTSQFSTKENFQKRIDLVKKRWKSTK